MRLLTVSLYFFIAIVFLASMGVTIPFIFETFKDGKHDWNAFNQNMATYYIAIFASASLDFILKKIDQPVSSKKAAILLIILINVIVFVGTGTLLYVDFRNGYCSIWGWFLFGTIVSYLMWWFAHYKDEAFNLSSSLGGNPEKQLSNG